MTEADLSPLLSKPQSEEKSEKKEKESKKDKKDKKEMKEKKRSRKEMEEEDQAEENVVQQTKSNGAENSAATKKGKSKLKSDHVPPPTKSMELICRTGRRNER